MYLIAISYNASAATSMTSWLKYGNLPAITRSAITLMTDDKSNKPKKFFGFEVSDTIAYIVIVVLFVIFVRQVWVLF